MARVAAYVPDLLFGSNVLGMLRAAGLEAELCGSPDALRRLAPGAAVLVLDLTAEVDERLTLFRELRADGDLDGTKTLAFYSHVEADVRDRAEGAGVERVVPRSRMARDGAQIVSAFIKGQPL